MKKFFKKSYLYEVLIILLLSLVPLLWFEPNTVIVGHDNIFALKPDVFLDGRFHTWIDHAFGQSQSAIMGTIAIHIVDALPYFLGFSIQDTQKIVYIFWFFLIGLSGYVLASVINKKSKVFKFTAAILYQYNFFLLQAWWIGERTKFSAYIALALILTVFLKVYKGELRPFHGAIISSLILFFFNAGGLFGMPLYGGLFISITVFVAYFCPLSIIRKRLDIVKNIISLIMLTVIGFIIINAYYIFPLLHEFSSQFSTRVERSGGVEGVIGWANEISANTSYSNLLRLQGIPEWYDNPEHPYAKYFFTNPLLIIISFLWPILVFLALFIVRDKKKNEIIIFFFIIYLVGIFFAAGTHRPLGFIYTFLLENIPGFVIFRTPYYKFASAIFLSSAFLIAFFIDRFKGKVKTALFISLCFITFLYNFPYFTGDFFSWRKEFSTRLTVPKYVFEFSHWLNNEKKGDGRVLMLPPNDHIAEYSRYEWGYLSFQALPTLFSNKSVVINDDKLSKEEKNLVVALYKALKDKNQNLVTSIASLLHVSHVLLQKDALYEKNSPLFSDIAQYQRFLNLANGFEPVKQFGEWEVYDLLNKNPSKMLIADHIYYLNQDIIEVDKIIDSQGRGGNTPSLFAFSNEKALLKIDDVKKTSLYVPECLNCIQINKPVIIFSQSNILPESPAYRLILIKEKLELKDSDPKTAIYNSLGLTTKRISEIKQTLILDRSINTNLINSYDELIDKIVENFGKLESVKDKVQVARDVGLYMLREREYLDTTLGTIVTGGKKSLILGKIYEKITYLEKYIDPHISKFDDLYNRLYEVKIDSPGNFLLQLKKGDLRPFLMDKSSTVSVEIDSKEKKSINVDSSIPDESLISFGNIFFKEGRHTLLLSYPESSFGNQTFHPQQTDFSTDVNKCFETSIVNYSGNKQNKYRLFYKNDFSDDVLISFWKVKENNAKELLDIYRLGKNLVEKKLEYFNNPSQDSKDMLITICAANITQELVNENFSLRVNEYISPSLILSPSTQLFSTSEHVSYSQINETKYEIDFKGNKSLPVFVFSERYDSGWKLNIDNATHFKVNGYANGWVINDIPDKLILEYEPERYYSIGKIVSIITASAGFLYLFYSLYKKYYARH